MAQTNHYATLGVPRDADVAQLKAARNKIAKENAAAFVKTATDAAATKRMQEVNAAYDILADKQKRAAHDRDLNRANSQSTTSRARTNAGAAGFRASQAHDPFEQMYREAMDAMDEMLREMHRRNGTRSQGQRQSHAGSTYANSGSASSPNSSGPQTLEHYLAEFAKHQYSSDAAQLLNIARQRPESTSQILQTLPADALASSAATNLRAHLKAVLPDVFVAKMLPYYLNEFSRGQYTSDANELLNIAKQKPTLSSEILQTLPADALASSAATNLRAYLKAILLDVFVAKMLPYHLNEFSRGQYTSDANELLNIAKQKPTLSSEILQTLPADALASSAATNLRAHLKDVLPDVFVAKMLPYYLNEFSRGQYTSDANELLNIAKQKPTLSSEILQTLPADALASSAATNLRAYLKAILLDVFVAKMLPYHLKEFSRGQYTSDANELLNIARQKPTLSSEILQTLPADALASSAATNLRAHLQAILPDVFVAKMLPHYLKEFSGGQYTSDANELLGIAKQQPEAASRILDALPADALASRAAANLRNNLKSVLPKEYASKMAPHYLANLSDYRHDNNATELRDLLRLNPSLASMLKKGLTARGYNQSPLTEEVDAALRRAGPAQQQPAPRAVQPKPATRIPPPLPGQTTSRVLPYPSFPTQPETPVRTAEPPKRKGFLRFLGL